MNGAGAVGTGGQGKMEGVGDGREGKDAPDARGRMRLVVHLPDGGDRRSLIWV